VSDNARVDLSPDYQAMRSDVGAFELPRDFLRVAGPDAVSWMQGQLSQDIAVLAVGEAAESLLLQPQGKVDAYLRVLRIGADEVVLDVDEGFGEAVLERLRRFKIRIKADIEAVDWHCLALRGPRAAEVGPFATGGTLVPADWPGLPGVDVLGEAPHLSEPAVRRCSVDSWQTLRIEAGIPAMGAELTERTIPAEAGIVGRTVSFTKGCYTGQELVARIDSRGGNVPRHLRGIVVEGATPPVGSSLVAGDKEVGALTSVAAAPSGTGVVALAYVRRDVEPPADVEVRWDGGTAGARVETLPLVG
jgi:folate-binding protein YgfZ